MSTVYTQRGVPSACVHTARVPTARVPTRTYHCVYTHAYMRVPVLPTHAYGPMRMSVYKGVPIRGPLWWTAFAVAPCSIPPSPASPSLHLVVWRVSARGLALPPQLCHPMGMDTSPALEPETMMALMLRYVEGYEEVAYQYARALVRRLTPDLSTHDALRLARDIVTEVTNDIGIFEGENAASRIDAELRQLINRVEADEAFMAELTKRAE